MTGFPSHEHHNPIKASGQINKRRDKGAPYEQQSSRELRVIESAGDRRTCVTQMKFNFTELITLKSRTRVVECVVLCRPGPSPSNLSFVTRKRKKKHPKVDNLGAEAPDIILPRS
jgi:hypothetical protein